MNLQSGVMRPGKVRSVEDNGIIKVFAPGLFNIEEEVDLLPKVMPWFIGSNTGSYSQPNIGDEVWVLNFYDNPLQLFWFKKDYVGEQWENLDISDGNIEIICNRESKNGWATIYFSDGSGWIIGNGETKIILNSDGDIQLNTNKDNRNIDINANGISIGTIGGSAHPAAYGDKVEEALNAICKLLQSVAEKAASSPYTATIGSEILNKITAVKQTIPEISSEHVTID